MSCFLCHRMTQNQVVCCFSCTHYLATRSSKLLTDNAAIDCLINSLSTTQWLRRCYACQRVLPSLVALPLCHIHTGSPSSVRGFLH